MQIQTWFSEEIVHTYMQIKLTSSDFGNYNY